MECIAYDPVSTKETNRNNAVYGIQKNRNPFIDHPELAEYIWGNKKGTPWSLTAGIDELKVEFTLSPNPAKDVLKYKYRRAKYFLFGFQPQRSAFTPTNIK